MENCLSLNDSPAWFSQNRALVNMVFNVFSESSIARLKQPKNHSTQVIRSPFLDG